jgi:hypothetical protein
MKISNSMINYYLGDVTFGWFNRHDVLPDDVADYHDYVMEIQKGAQKHGDTEYLRIALEYLLNNPKTDYERYDGGRYPYDGDEVREIIEYVLRTLWPDATPVPAEELAKVELVEASIGDWWSSVRGT